MDIPREQAKGRRRIKRIIYGVSIIAAVAVITVGVSRLKPAPPTIDVGYWPGTVARGPMLRNVRGLGTLVPEDIRWVPAPSEGRIERILVKQGAVVKADSILVELSNPVLEQSLLEAEQTLKGSEAELNSLHARLNNDLLNQKAQAATVQADYKTAKLQADVNVELRKSGLVSDLVLKLSQVRAEELATRFELEQQRLETNAQSAKAQIAQQQARVDQLKGSAELRRSQVNQLHVRSGLAGVVQLVAVQVGAQATPGMNLARVADPAKLKAELKVAETQTKDLEIGQKAEVDTRTGGGAGNSKIMGRVVRIDPAPTNGTLTVDIALEGELPKGARPDLSVDGTIELERLDNVLYVNRPVNGQENGTVGLFRIEPGTNLAYRVQVKLGRTAVSTIEIVDGLREGDKVILSDMAAYDSHNVVRVP
ncbi:MAG TPA: HlyD family efflux transporter periplasmic adaptor subunit [Blastocatellia bacterium]|nr:HlyD family efflux transporter periplasmic adaptor subunit [Blastocatellia bacterium]